jgi:hypothetical protein
MYQQGVTMKHQREMSRTQFKAACKRYGFRPVLMWLEDISGQTPGYSYGMVISLDGKILYRASLASAFQARRRYAWSQEEKSYYDK